jgi:hypothetical protein
MMMVDNRAVKEGRVSEDWENQVMRSSEFVLLYLHNSGGQIKGIKCSTQNRDNKRM